MPTFQNKRKSRKSTFKAFGDFIALHMVKKLRKNKTERHQMTSDALEAGFSQDDSKLGNGHGNGRGVNRSSSMNAASSLAVKRNVVDVSSLSSVPGVFGLGNHGNTCFINAVVQCLSNTDVLAEYFVLGAFRAHLSRKERSKKYGTRGELAEHVAAVIRNLWTGTCTPEMTKALKEVVSKHGAQYKGNSQHDAQEFLLWLLDKLHEDLNTAAVVKRNPFSRQKSFRKSKHPPERIESLRPTSVIHKTFQGQYHSSLRCPNCDRRSVTGDPFLSVSLPLAQRTTRAVFVNVVFLPSKRKSGRRGFAGRTVRIGVEVPATGGGNQLRQAVSFECGVHSRLLAFVELRHDGFGESFGDEKEISALPAANESLYAFEMPPLVRMTAGTLPRNLRKLPPGGDAESVVVILVNKQGIGEQGRRFGRPLVFRTSREVTLSDLQSVVLSQMGEFVKDGVRHEKMGTLFRLQIHDGLPSKSYLSSPRAPLRLPTVDRALQNCPAGGPLHVRLVAEWDTDTKSALFGKFPDEKVEVQESVRLQRLLSQQPITCSLEECLALHTREEVLSGDDLWLCPFCHTGQHGATKKLSLSSPPDVLVVHLKRFKVADGKRTKLTTRVEFPVTGLDLSQHLHRPESNGHHFPHSRELYDLYAVCNHHGNLNCGHYTACCSNPLNGRWYRFDDTTTECITEQELSPQSVYILFYQRRAPTPALSCTSVNSVMSDHWSLRLPQFKQSVQFNSLSHLNHLSTGNPSLQANINNNASKIAHVAQQLQVAQQPAQKGDKKGVKKGSQSFKEPRTPDWNKNPPKNSPKNSPKLDSDDGGFDDPRRPFVRGLHRQGSAVVRGHKGRDLGSRQYKSYRDRRKRSSHV